MFVLLLIQLLITLLTVISFSPLHTHTQICRLTGASRVSRLSKAHRLSMITKNTSTKQLEKQLESLFSSNEMTGRGAKASTKVLDEVNEIITQLENNSNRIKNPIDSKLIDGCWRLIYTSSPGTNSPIQRSFTAFDGVTIYQIVNLVDTTKSYLSNNQPDVSNVVCFGKNGRLRVTALASTVSSNYSAA